MVDGWMGGLMDGFGTCARLCVCASIYPPSCQQAAFRCQRNLLPHCFAVVSTLRCATHIPDTNACTPTSLRRPNLQPRCQPSKLDRTPPHFSLLHCVMACFGQMSMRTGFKMPAAKEERPQRTDFSFPALAVHVKCVSPASPSPEQSGHPCAS